MIIGGSTLTAEGSARGKDFVYPALVRMIDDCDLLTFNVMNDSVGYIVPDSDYGIATLRYMGGELTYNADGVLLRLHRSLHLHNRIPDPCKGVQIKQKRTWLFAGCLLLLLINMIPAMQSPMPISCRAYMLFKRQHSHNHKNAGKADICHKGRDLFSIRLCKGLCRIPERQRQSRKLLRSVDFCISP